MEVEAARKDSVFKRLGGQPVRNKVCTYWLAGRCNKNPCRFMHRELTPARSVKSQLPSPGDNHQKQSRKMVWRNPNYCFSKTGVEGRVGKNTKSIPQKVHRRKHSDMDQEIADATIGKDSSAHAEPNVLADERSETDKRSDQENQPKQCKNWIIGNCIRGDKCKDLHSWFYGFGLTMLTKLEGHTKAISGISLSSGHDKLFSGGEDGCVRASDSHGGQCIGLTKIDGEVGRLITEGPWLFIGLHNSVKAWNLQSQAEFTLNASSCLVCSMATDDDKLFVGTEDGSILVWNWQPGGSIPEPIAVLKAHNGAVRSLVVGAKRLYSGSRDCTIKEWDVQNLKCLQTLHGHTRDVTAVLCWDCYLLSASLDNTLKVWAATESGTIEMVYEIKEDYGPTALCGIHDAEAKPILLCLYNDNTVRLYELPSFTERGRIFSKHEVRVIQIGVDGLFFTGDSTGDISIWKLVGSPCTTSS